MIEMFKANGYVPGVSLWGFPYDWRQDFSLPIIMNPLIDRIKSAYESCGGKKIDIISHSMGGLVFRTFCQLYPELVTKYVRRWITIASPFQGASRMIEAMLYGYTFGMPKIIVDPWVVSEMMVWYSLRLRGQMLGL
ncbi:MAG: putative phospholipase A1 [Streblomastix strix]|uniref:Putative phospholipase A1 n=1 Tax=Streblomastix strix TaxID=222440 RepID=A0A5J4WHN4_9EUKA|nr:MAG: putative phospholipase A1 [Streblomastix strix]